MAQRVQIILEDDYDGGTAEETVSFALDGAEYEIDLSSKNASGLRDALAPWVAHARRLVVDASGPTNLPARPAPVTSGRGHSAKVTKSAAAAESRQRCGTPTRRLMLDLSARRLSDPLSRVSSVGTTGIERSWSCALGQHCSPRAPAVQGMSRWDSGGGRPSATRPSGPQT